MSGFASGQLKLNYEERGTGFPVIMLHGFGMSAHLCWVANGWLELLSAQGFRAIALDSRGHGLSDKPIVESEYAAELMTRDVINLLDHLSIQRAHFIGHSMGARTAFDIALKYPERLVSLIGVSVGANIDIVGIAKLARIDALDDAAIDQQFDVVLRHAMLTVQIAAPLLARRGGGSLSFIGSLAGMAAMPNLSFHGIAKAALLQLVRCAALEFGPAGVRVNAVVPGYTSTPRLLEMLPAETWERVAANNPLRRVATPEDIAKALLFLVSDLADYVTGNILTLDGGVSRALLMPGTG